MNHLAFEGAFAAYTGYYSSAVVEHYTFAVVDWGHSMLQHYHHNFLDQLLARSGLCMQDDKTLLDSNMDLVLLQLALVDQLTLMVVDLNVADYQWLKVVADFPYQIAVVGFRQLKVVVVVGFPYSVAVVGFLWLEVVVDFRQLKVAAVVVGCLYLVVVVGFLRLMVVFDFPLILVAVGLQ